MNGGRKIVLVRLCIIALVVNLAGWAIAAQPSDTPRLWQSLSASTTPSGGKVWIIREQAISFPEPVLSMLTDPSQALPLTFAVDLDGVIRTVDMTKRSTSELSSTIVQGRLQGAQTGEIFLAIHGEAVAGTVSLGQRRWKIEYTGRARHRLIEFDPEKLPPD